MKSFFTLLLVVVLSTFEFGCFFGKNDLIEPVDYDLVLSEKPLVLPVPVEVETFRNLSGSDRRMALRYSGGRVTADEYCRWLLPPEILLQRSFMAALPRQSGSESGDGVVRLDCVLYRFDFDIEIFGFAIFADVLQLIK